MFKCINFSICFQITFILLSIKYSFTAPVEKSESLYTKFVKEMRMNNCVIPEQVHLPFNISSAENVEYMPSSLKICQNLESTTRQKEAVILCKEIFVILKTISCPLRAPTGTAVSAINVTLSNQVCKDFSSMEKSVLDDNSLLKRLTDPFLCDMMCDAEFEKACQVLLWSHQVQEQIENNQNPKNLSNVKDLSPLEINPDTGDKTGQAKSNEENNLMDSKLPITLGARDEGAMDQQFVKTKASRTQESSTQIQNVEKNVPQLPVNKESPIQTQAGNTPPAVPKVYTKTKVAGKEEDALANANNIGELDQVNEVGNPPLNVDTEIPESEKEHTKAGSAVLPEEDADPHDKEEFDDRIQIETDKDHVEVSADAANQNQGKDNQITSKLEDTNQDATNQNQDKDNRIITHFEDANHDETQGQIPGKTVMTTQGNSKTKEATTPQMGKDQVTTLANKKVNVSAESTLVGKVTGSTVEEKTATKISSILPQTKDVVSDSGISSDLPTTGDLGSETIVTTVALEKMEDENDALQPADKEPDQYTGPENDIDPEEEYNGEGGIYEPERNKEPKSDKPDIVEVPKVSDQSEKTYNEFPSRDNFGRRPEDIQVIAAFPEQEDSHFFFYFLSIVLILMAGYLVFHNKQKIIALIVEGRHERRRRSHGVGYKKLETK